MAHRHDTGYKFLFSHAELVQELLEVFAPPGVSGLLDYASLRRETGSFVTPAMKRREDDIVWSMELKADGEGRGQRIYLYLLLEFQSTIDRGMPLRMMQYVAALYDHLVRSQAVKLKDGLPPVLPIVLYNGDKRWKPSPEIFDLIQPHPAALTEFQPRLKFWLLDEGRFAPEYLEGLQRVMAAIFLVEQTGESLDAVKRAIRHFGQTLANSPRRARIDKALIDWLHQRTNQKLPMLKLSETEDLLEMTNMLETNIERLMKRERQEGVLLGRLEGRLEGESALIERLIVKRFGPLSDDTRARLAAASAEQLEAWAERILDATTLAEVFGDQ